MVMPAHDESESDSRSDGGRSTEWSSAGFDGSSSAYENASEESSQVAADVELPLSPGQAAAIIQGMYRRKKARELLVERARQVYEKVYDEENDVYFYYDKVSGTSRWSIPEALLGRDIDPREEWAATKTQSLWRRRRDWRRLLSVLNSVYEREYDPDTNTWFYVNKVTRRTSWEKPRLFGDKEPPTNASDLALLDKDRKIEDLKRDIDKYRTEAAEAKKDLEDRIVEDRVRNGDLDLDEARGRSRHMDEWNIDAVVAWFHAIGYTQYDESLKEHQVDGLLLLHLMNEDWGHLGINSPLIVRRLDVAMQEYRIRFERKQAGNLDNTDEGSDASASDTPSELLDEDDLYGDDDDSELQDEEGHVDDADENQADEHELAELRRDAENMRKETIFAGDGKGGSPVVGHVVRIHYTCALQKQESQLAIGKRGSDSDPRALGKGSEAFSEGLQIESSRRSRRRPLEFVIGAGQVIKGIDRGVRTMLSGERARIFVSAAYAYGDKGHPPIIPPCADLVFDINVLDTWPRPRWHKPLVQILAEPYSERPFAPRLPEAEEKLLTSVDDGRGTKSADKNVQGDFPFGKAGNT